LFHYFSIIAFRNTLWYSIGPFSEIPQFDFKVESMLGPFTCSGVSEFVAEEGIAHLPNWMMRQLNLAAGQQVRISWIILPKGVMAKLRIGRSEHFPSCDPVVKDVYCEKV
jgi:hypothetical protein